MEDKNVYGEALQPCSKEGSARTGYGRDGKCRSWRGDEGRHNVCVEMEQDFCDVTKQGDWCTSRMECQGGEGECEVKEWCACEWATASYVEKAGCSSLNIICDATNAKALYHYEARSAEGNERARKALSCLKEQCQVE